MMLRFARCRAAGSLIMVLGLLAYTAVPAGGQDVRMRLSADSVAVGERFALTLVATGPAATAPVFPGTRPDSAGGIVRFGDLEVIERRRSGGREVAGGRVDSIVYEVTTFALDSAFVPALGVRFLADADTFTVAAAARWLPVVSRVPADAAGVRDLAPPVDFPAPLWPWILLLLGVLVVGGLAYHYLRRKKPSVPEDAPPPPPAIPAYEEALGRLERLREVDVRNLEYVKPFYVELSELLRTYAARRLGVAALEHTTRELAQVLRRHPSMNEALCRHWRQVLELADLVKFADARPSAEQSRQALSAAGRLLRDTEMRASAADHRHAEEPASLPAAPSLPS